jgi:hypothetical protein
MVAVFRERDIPGDEALGHGKVAHTREPFQVPDANTALSVGRGEETAVGRHGTDFNWANVTWDLGHGDLAVEHDGRAH